MSRPLPSANVCVVVGTLRRTPEVRALRSGEVVAELEVRVEQPDAVETVPVTVSDPPASVLGLPPGAPVVVRGRVRRRFFRAGGTTQSRTEVVAAQIEHATRRARVRRLLDGARADLAPG